MPFISEGLVTTRRPDGTTNLSPMGPIVDPDYHTLLLRPFASSRTYKNLKATREGVFHVTDNACLIAKAAVGILDTLPKMHSAIRIEGSVLEDCCRWFEFRVTEMDESQERIEIKCEVIHTETKRDFFGFNRANHALLEAAIHATRLHLQPQQEILSAYEQLRTIVHKTGTEEQTATFELLSDFATRFYAERMDRSF